MSQERMPLEKSSPSIEEDSKNKDDQWSPKSGKSDSDEGSLKRSRHSGRSPSPVEKTKKRYKNTGSRKRSRSDSPRQEDRKLKKCTKNNVDESHCLGVFGLSSATEERDLKEVFSAYGDIDKLCLIYDRQSGHSKGFAFVYYKSTADATTAKKETQGLLLNGRPMRVDYSLTLRPHSPTSGRYDSRERYSHGYKSSRSRYEDDYGCRSQNHYRTSYYNKYRRNRDNYDDYDEPYERSSSKRYSSQYRHH